MRDVLKQLLTSKKALVTLVAVIVWALGRFGLDVAADDLLPLVVALATFVVSQGLADHGKEKAKVEAARAQE